MKTKTTKEERKGIKMIQFLQNMAGIKEPPGKALKGWRAMSDYEKQNTTAAYELFAGSKPTKPKT